MSKRPDEPRRRLSKWDRERQRRRILQFVIAFVIVVALVLVGFGYWDSQVKPWNQVIVKINDVEFDMRYFVNMLSIWLPGTQPHEQVYYARMVAEDIMPVYEIKRQLAAKMGVEVTEEEVRAHLIDFFDYDPEEQSEADFSKKLEENFGLTLEEVKELLVKPMALEKKMQQVIREQDYDGVFEHAKIEAILVGTEQTALEFRQKWETYGFGALTNQTGVARYYPNDDHDGWFPAGIETEAFDAYLFGGSANLNEISQPIRDTANWTRGGYWVVQVMERAGEDENITSRILAILVDSEVTAQDLHDRIAAGEDFAELAEEYSLHTTSKAEGGEMGWLDKDGLKGQFGEDNVNHLLTIDLETVTGPLYNENISKQSSYWLINVLDHKDDHLIDSDAERIVQKVFNDMVEEETAAANIQVFLEGALGEERIAWALRKANL